jgi:hypothetical protein
MQPILARLGVLCDQVGAADFLEYFLTSPENLKKIPNLILVTSTPCINPHELRAEDIRGAVLIFEYKVLGLRSRVFTSNDFDGRRAVIAPAKTKVHISTIVCRYLMEHGAQIVCLIFAPGSEESCKPCLEQAMAGAGNIRWATRTRPAGASFALAANVEATLATMGSHTRRNFRYYRRKAETELQCTFCGDIRSTLTRAQLSELNRASTHPVPDSVLDRRYKTLKTMDGLFCIGLKAVGGQWISLLGGRRHHGTTEIDWQMNRSGLAKYSIGTIIRYYLIEHEIGIGTKNLFFEGGTPHSMRHSFLPQEATDIIAANRSPFVSLLRKAAPWTALNRNFVIQTLVNPELEWNSSSAAISRQPIPVQTSIEPQTLSQTSCSTKV